LCTGRSSILGRLLWGGVAAGLVSCVLRRCICDGPIRFLLYVIECSKIVSYCVTRWVVLYLWRMACWKFFTVRSSLCASLYEFFSELVSLLVPYFPVLRELVDNVGKLRVCASVK
jgi:hypothetical protein